MSIFSNVAGRRTRKSKFNLSHERKMSLNMGELVPILCEEIVPGDNFKVNSELLMRFSPMIAPMMHRVNVYTHYFFVPNRLVWDNWQSFITGGRQGDELPVMPKFHMSESRKAHFAKGKLPDYFGLPIIDPATTVTQSESISALPFRAYQTIFNEYYQDQNLSDPITVLKDDGDQGDTAYTEMLQMRKRAWEKDYFTSALPWAQRTTDEPIVPADVNYKKSLAWSDDNIPSADGSMSTLNGRVITGASQDVIIENIEDLGITINDLRKSVRLQEWLERTARGGSRYIEQILSHFGVRSSDARLMRPEFLGGGKNPVVISEVLNTTGALDNALPTGFFPQGNMSGHGISVGRNNGFNRRFEEHGYVIGIMSVLPKTAYQQGIHKHWSRRDKFDYYWPEFSQLGEQEVLNKEIYFDPANADTTQKNKTFGYQSRYAEYKYSCSTVHGDFRDTLNFWHMGRIFSAPPALNNSFVESDPDPRIFAVTDPDEDKLYCQIYNSVSAIRPMPRFNNPSL